mmetsp:Transcript_8224/g.24265  ORF Transcript_8224/g.24265 Transcript_8224/m.24265 type:complete len:206 (+) Transcript_8224:1013-1630(+)
MAWVGRVVLEVLEVDILWPRWVARIGVTRSTQACFLAADRQCTELPLLRLPRLVHGFRGSDPMRQTRDLARVGWRGLAPFLPIGPRERPRLADSYFAPGSGARGIPRVARPAIRRVAAMRRKEWGPRRLSPALRGGKGIAGSPRAPQFGPPEGGRGARGWGDLRAVGRGLGFMWLILALSGRGLSAGESSSTRPPIPITISHTFI